MNISNRLCHYCSKRSDVVGPLTRDHIVPRYRIRGLRLPPNHPFFGQNIVPACSPCNGRKGAKRSPCACQKCRHAWEQFMLLSIGIDCLKRVA